MRPSARFIFCALLATPCLGRAGEDVFVPPKSLQAIDVPDDAGGTICLTWRRSPSESTEWDYVVFGSEKPDGDFKEVQRFPSTALLKSHLPEIFGFSEENETWHAVKIERLSVGEPEELTKLRDESGQAASAQNILERYHNADRSLRMHRRKHGDLPTLKKRSAQFEKDIEPLNAKVEAGEEVDEAKLKALTRKIKRLRQIVTERQELEHKQQGLKESYKELTHKDLESVADITAELNRLTKLRRDADSKIKVMARAHEPHPCYFGLGAVPRGSTEPTEPFKDLQASAAARANVFIWSDANTFTALVGLSVVIFASIAVARRKELYLRKIAGLDAVDEALGRATEMGKPALFVHGLSGVSSVAVIASVNILGRMARRVAEYDTGLLVVNNDAVVYSLSSEVVREGYLEAGRPDRFREDHIYMVASRQFPYVAAVAGIMARERPAANFFMGHFYAESLILAESGAATGAIQIAGTDAFTQLPFFVTTCDYTLMGEELYAASAYLSREPKLLGTLRGQDIGKAFLIVALLVGTLAASLGMDAFVNLFKTF